MVKLRQSGLQGRSVTVTVAGRRLGGENSGERQAEFKVGEKTITLQSSVETADIPFTPDESGRFEFTATVDKVEGEIVDQNNHASREVNIIGANGWTRGDLEALLVEVERGGTITPIIDRVFPLAESREAMRVMEARELFGKIIIRP